MKFAPPTRWVNAIFCDDVREEAGGKMSYMGIYRGGMQISASFPVELPKFVVVANYSEPAAEEWLPLTIKVYLPGQEDDAAPAVSFEIPLESVGQPPPGTDLTTASRQIIMPITFAPLLFSATGKMRLQVERAGVVYRAGSLKVSRADDDLSSVVGAGDTRDSK